MHVFSRACSISRATYLLTIVSVSRACPMSRASDLLTIVSVWLVGWLVVCLLVGSCKISSDFKYSHSL